MRSLGTLAVVAVASSAAAEDLTPITDRDWALDLYDGAAIGSARIVGMGGTAVASAQGSSGSLANPAAAAVRSATSTKWWDWDFHLDAQSAVFTSDLDNNGQVTDAGAVATTFGLAGMLHDWGLAVVMTTLSTTIGSGDEKLAAQALRGKVALARAFANEAITVGIGVRIGQFSLDAEPASAGNQALFRISGSSLETGVILRPFRGDVRLGASVSLPFTGDKVDVADCDPLNCGGHILPQRVAAPWQGALGAAWRFAPTRWNQWVGGRFRDERALIVAADLIVTGHVPDGKGIEAFGDGLWQTSGRRVVLSPRLGAEYEVLPGNLRLRGGTYWEPGRFLDVGGRAHLTLGVEGGFYDFRFWGSRYRLRASLTGDIAPRYGNAGVSLGFWN